MPKLKLEFDGWHCLSKKQQNEILEIARRNFKNANFNEKNGLLIEDDNELNIHKFSVDIINSFEKTLNNWDGYTIRKVSKKLLFNYADRKRKLQFEFFKKLVVENNLKDSKIILAGILYLEPNEIKDILMDIQREYGMLFSDMKEEELMEAYKTILIYASANKKPYQNI